MTAEARPFTYAVLQLIPCIQRGERINVGVALFCRQFDFLELRITLDPAKLAALAPDADREAINQQLKEIRGVIEGDAARGTLAAMNPSDRFGWLVAPSSTVIQSSDAHTGLTTDPATELDRLFKNLVL